MAAKRVLSVGQCAADHSALSRMLRDRFGAEVDTADTPRDAFHQLRRHRYDLVLVNRLLARDGSGQDFIARLKGDPSLGRVPVMLVSNFAEAQQQAVASGALPGFGKAALDDPETWQRLEAALSGASTAEGAHRP